MCIERKIDQPLVVEKRAPALLRRIMKPRLPRRIVSNARVNLNKFWTDLEEVYLRREASLQTQAVGLKSVWDSQLTEEEENRANVGNYQRTFWDSRVVDEAEENKINEMLERKRQQLDDSPTV